MTTRVLHRSLSEPRPAAFRPKYILHDSFAQPDAETDYSGTPQLDERAIEQTHMPDEVTRDLARRMHYAGWRSQTARRPAVAERWLRRYLDLRDRIVVGNRKLIYRAVRRRMAVSNRADDLIGDCHIVLIQAVAAYNPWMGVRFSTYAYTCLVRALSRLSRRIAADWLGRSLSLDAVAGAEPAGWNEAAEPAGIGRVEEYLRDDHPLLSSREKAIIRRRFNLAGPARGQTLEKVGRAMGLSKERVRQVQATALGKLRQALLGEPVG